MDRRVFLRVAGATLAGAACMVPSPDLAKAADQLQSMSHGAHEICLMQRCSAVSRVEAMSASSALDFRQTADLQVLLAMLCECANARIPCRVSMVNVADYGLFFTDDGAMYHTWFLLFGHPGEDMPVRGMIPLQSSNICSCTGGFVYDLEKQLIAWKPIYLETNLLGAET